MIGIEMDFEISSDDIDLSHKAGVPSSGKNRPIIIKFIRYNDRRRIFTNKKILKGGDLSITKVRDEAIKNVKTSDGKIIYRAQGNTNAKIYFNNVVTSSTSVMEKKGNTFVFF